MNRRDFLTGTVIGGGLLMSGATNLRASAFSSQYITVGIGGDYDSLQGAIDAVESSASESFPYLIKLLPGVHVLTGGETVLPQWVALEGSGQEITMIEFLDESAYLSAFSNSRISQLSLHAYRGGPNSAPGMLVAKRSRVVDFYLDNVTFYLTGGHQAAVYQIWYNHVWFWNNVNIYTTSIGVEIRGYQYLRNSNVFLSGNATNTPYLGFYVPGMCRLYAWNLKCGTGYGETTHSGFGSKLEVRSDAGSDVIGFYIPSNETDNPRIELHNIESYCHNGNVNSDTVRVNCIRAEAGIVRMFGCFTQAETPLNWGIGQDIFCAPSATIEFYGGRYTRLDGNLSSRNQQAVSYKSAANDGEVLTVGPKSQHGGSFYLCDASEGSISLTLPGDWIGGQPPGIFWTFIKTDTTNNRVTIKAPSLGSISGENEKILGSPYERVRIVHDEINSNRWFQI